MKVRVLLSTVALIAVTSGVHAQATHTPSGSLTAFRSTTELSSFLSEIAQRRQQLMLRRSTAQKVCSGGGAFVRSRTRAPGKDAATIVRGRVTSPGAPLSQAVVELVDPQISVTTASNGAYTAEISRAKLAKKQTVALKALAIGYGTRELKLSLQPGEIVVADFVLCETALFLDELVVASAAMSVADAITNVQHAGVDEGGIVKVHGDHLIILRRGRLFTVNVGGSRLDAVSAVDAFGGDIEPGGTWYDELLVSGNNVIVIGYSYARGGTELGFFRIDDRGRLVHRDTYHLRSNDYYSSRNYSSRLIGSKLVLYTPLMLPLGGELNAQLPALRRWRAGARPEDFRPIVSATRVYRPGAQFDMTWDVTLHTVTSCDLAAPELTCEASAVLGPTGRVFYVSPHAVYVWVSSMLREANTTANMLYRMPLDGGAPSALGVNGSPVDQFSFLESDDGHINVLVRNGAFGDGMWRAERARGDVALLRVPIARFSDGRAAAPRPAYRELPMPHGGHAFHNRFVGQHVLYGDGSGWGRPDNSGRSVLYAARWTDGAVAELSLPHGVDRIEVMGSNAVVMGTDGRDLHFTGIALGALPSIAQRYVRRNASQGELRSHGFFYRADEASAGVIGLPIRRAAAAGYEHLFDGSAAVLFLRNDGTRFGELGELAADAASAAANDQCRASCVDWYGNARPLFLRNRVFALMGYEIVEGALSDGRLRELRRVNFAPRIAEAAAR